MDRRFPLALVAAGLLAGSLLAAPAPVRADDDAGTPCTFEVDVALSPGLSRSPSSGTFDSKGERGVIDCRGDVNGKPATGRGTFGAEGHYGTDGDGDNCQSKDGRGDGTAHLTVPVDGGSEHVDDPFTLTYRVDGRSVVGEINGERFRGTFDVTKAEGDCLWHPVTRIHIKGQGRLRDDDVAPPAPFQ
ncbi:MAG TPA: hypothetical protein VHL53_21035 [Acidimicrobiia bacterium]|nr:hypothetical protein [Acidimicrobiia bacterium]